MTSAGTPVYSIPLGIIMLDCKFPRITGDIGNAKTFPFPVQYEVLFDVDFKDLIYESTPEAVNLLITAAKKLERIGVRAITTSCGLLLKHQKILSSQVKIPVAVSSVLLLPTLTSILPSEKKILVVCSDSSSLSSSDIAQYTLVSEERFSVHGLEHCFEFHEMFNVHQLEKTCTLDKEVIYGEIYSSCEKVIKDATKPYGALLLECTNLGPYREELAVDFGLPVFDFLSLGKLLYSGVI